MFADRTNWNLAPNRLSEALRQRRDAGSAVIDLTASNPTKCGFQYHRQAILQAVSNPSILDYDPDPRGLKTARDAVAAYYAGHGAPISPDDIILTTSTSECYSFIFRTLCNPSDEILVPQPSYPLFDFLAELHDVRLVRYPLLYDHSGDHGWQIDFSALQRAITPRTRAVIVVHPNNPTGHFTRGGELERLNEICSARQMALIADEVFLDFAYAAARPRSFAGNTVALTFTMSGLSKIAGLPQMKSAWLVANGPPQLKAQALQRLEVIADTYLSGNAPVQLATPELLQRRNEFQAQVMARVRRNLTELDRQLGMQKLCSRLKLEGGWYAILRVPATQPGEEFAVELLTTKGVYVHPGHFYDFASEGRLIVSLIAREPEFAKGIELLLSMF
jgi:aspartate/methionine/tyrosine aminotransferase